MGDAVSIAVGAGMGASGLMKIITALVAGGAITITTSGIGAGAGVAVSVAGIAIGAIEAGYAVAVMQAAISNFNNDYDKLRKLGKGTESAGQWNKGSFDNPEDSLNWHFQKHGQEVGAKNAGEYMRKAEEFAKNIKGATKKQIGGSTSGVTRYYKNGKYIDIASDNTIVSFGKQ